MRTLSHPSFVAKDVFRQCIANVRDRDLSRRLNSVIDNVEAAAETYIEKAENEELYEFPRDASVGGCVTTREMMDVYTGRFVPKGSRGRDIYNAIVAAAPRGRCPICAVGQVTTLDHHLPKAHYPVLSVTPSNLVPSCTWCQTSKMQGFPASAEAQTLHPYFDNYEDERWLCAEVVPTIPAAFLYSVRNPAGWSDVTVARLQNHLKTFKLLRLFAANAAEELTDIRYSLQLLTAASGPQAVRDHLLTEAQSRERAFKNSWRTAMYHAASESDWFCIEGFASV